MILQEFRVVSQRSRVFLHFIASLTIFPYRCILMKHIVAMKRVSRVMELWLSRQKCITLSSAGGWSARLIEIGKDVEE